MKAFWILVIAALAVVAFAMGASILSSTDADAGWRKDRYYARPYVRPFYPPRARYGRRYPRTYAPRPSYGYTVPYAYDLPRYRYGRGGVGVTINIR